MLFLLEVICKVCVNSTKTGSDCYIMSQIGALPVTLHVHYTREVLVRMRRVRANIAYNPKSRDSP